MPQLPTRSRNSSTLVLQCALIAAAVTTRNLMFLSGAFALSGVAIYRLQFDRRMKGIALLFCLALTIAPIGYQLGKDVAVRDNAANTSVHATKP